MEVFLGGTLAQTNAADGELDQQALKNLGFTTADEKSSDTAGIDKEVHKFLPDGLSVSEFDKDWTEEDDQHEDLYMIRFFPNGQCDWFKMELEDNRGVSVKLEIDPISGKVESEFVH